MRLSALLLLFVAVCSACQKKAEPPQARPVPVGVVKAQVKDAPVVVNGIGHVVAMRTVTVTPQVTGLLKSVEFKEGAIVREGDLLAVIDPKPFEAKVAEALGALKRDWTRAEQAGRDHLRYKDLVQKEVVSRDDYEQKRTEFESSWQQVRSDQGALETARINLAYCRITSPVSGAAGYQNVKPGNVVNANTTAIATINQVQPVLVRFSVNEADLPLVRSWFGKEAVPVTARVPKEENDIKERGVLTAIDNAVDVQTGMIMLQAQFDNKELTLWPGQFVNVQAVLTVEKDRTVIPSDAVMTRQDGSFVFVVSEKSTAELRKVTTGRMVGRREVVILSGVAPGETIISDGVIRVAPGGAVTVQGAGAPQ
ncbi:efflux RND transporter periplasmic adaptor subunit [Fundidesulfovibrio soli]|uniref:efflux RND transporter periplasmic adaptor subunit n=1 Tax=Fundidesulfovibrio soli TaxID=2922716 RepID=UPI001FB00D71|nr:efflux RND transporter periplasmic adaptor subunit [Fundidesulfovibrio soli]